MSKKQTNRLLNEIESKEWLIQSGLPVLPAFLAKNHLEAQQFSREIGFPVVMKIISPDIPHKSDVGGVKLDLQNISQVDQAYQAILDSVNTAKPGAGITGISVQKMAPRGVEMIIGMSLDSQFGPVIMFGLGGTLVEIFKDVSFRLIPITLRDAAEMVHEIKSLPLLQGYRGSEPVNLAAVEKLLVDISRFIEHNPQIQELDLNPVYGYRDGVLAVDARIVVND
jgi:acetate---CoA ligase (ADP-forming) subunit beta